MNKIRHIKRQKGCHICKKKFNTDDNDKDRGHCHFTGKYRGASDNVCNPNYKALKEIPAGENTEKYITFSISIKND